LKKFPQIQFEIKFYSKKIVLELSNPNKDIPNNILSVYFFFFFKKKSAYFIILCKCNIPRYLTNRIGIKKIKKERKKKHWNKTQHRFVPSEKFTPKLGTA
jgi:hypothetical protein